MYSHSYHSVYKQVLVLINAMLVFSPVEDAEQKKKRLALMEKLRSKRSTQHRSWTESLKTIRTAVVVSLCLHFLFRCDIY